MALVDLPPRSGAAGPSDDADAMRQLSVEELLDLRAQIDELLPIRSLKQVNMEQELVFQLQTVQRLQLATLASSDIPANQRAQVAGAVASVLASLAKLQVEVYDSERLKQIEAIMIELVKDLPLEYQSKFLDTYEAKLGAVHA